MLTTFNFYRVLDLLSNWWSMLLYSSNPLLCHYSAITSKILVQNALKYIYNNRIDEKNLQQFLKIGQVENNKARRDQGTWRPIPLLALSRYFDRRRY